MDIDIAWIAAGGDGVGRADGVVVFTPRTAPEISYTCARYPSGGAASREARS